MNLSFQEDESLLTLVSDEGVSWAHGQGYFWFWECLMPALTRAEQNSNISRELIADCYYVVGDVHDFNDAPKAAIKAYEKALDFDPSLAAAYREIALMQSRIGEYEKAVALVDKALELDPEDEFARDDRDNYLQEINNLSRDENKPLYQSGDPIWDANEFLAAHQPTKALLVVDGVETIEALKIRAGIYSVIGKGERYADIWKDVCESTSELEFEYSDWFYMPEDVAEEQDFWGIFLEKQTEYKGVFIGFDSLLDSNRYESLSQNEKIRLIMKFLHLKAANNKVALRDLFKLYPEWVELKEVCEAS